MQDAVVNKIKSKIAHDKFGEVYFVSSFPQYILTVNGSFRTFSASFAPNCLAIMQKNINFALRMGETNFAASLYR